MGFQKVSGQMYYSYFKKKVINVCIDEWLLGDVIRRDQQTIGILYMADKLPLKNRALYF